METIYNLLEDTPVAAYWNGFLMADGSFSEKRLACSVSEKDEGHLEALRAFIGGNPLRKVPQVNAVSLDKQVPDAIAKLRQKFDIHSRKTWNPPTHLPFVDKALLRCWLIGFIDGDGSISIQTGRKSSFIRTVSHPSWHTFMQGLSDSLEIGTVSTRSDGYTQLGLFKHNEVVALKDFARGHNLPVLNRKWDLIDSSFVVRGGMKDKVLQMIADGYRNKDICAVVGCSTAYPSKLRKEKL